MRRPFVTAQITQHGILVTAHGRSTPALLTVAVKRQAALAGSLKGRHRQYLRFCSHTGKKYASPTAFTVAVKRQAAPAGRQGNDGWRSALYEGAPLEKYRKQYAAQYDAPVEEDEVKCCALPIEVL